MIQPKKVVVVAADAVARLLMKLKLKLNRAHVSAPMTLVVKQIEF